jgi:cellulose synthase/poly-beta-1,6-N-acetylglucosamine synthase-like glycosyltransferase
MRTSERRGKTNAQNEGVPHCTGEVIVFSDATTIYHPQALRFLAANYVDPTVGAVSGRYDYFDPDGHSPTGLGSIAFWNYENFIKTLQSSICTISGCCGCIYSVRKSLYTPLADDVISDLVQPLWVIKQGYRVVFEDRALAYEETTTSSKHEFRMRVRVVTRGMQGILSVPDILNAFRRPWVAFQLFSHKVLRWLVPLFLIGLFVSTALLRHEPFYEFLFVAQVVFYGFALLATVIPALSRWRVLTIPLYFCTLNAAAVVGLIEVMRGRKYVVWQPVRTTPEKAKTV